ncbi:MAG: ferredoxin reductase [Nocardioidaceae bacterium]
MSTTTIPATGVRPGARGLAQRVLRSSTLAALTSPHGVDRYLELVNPMWAAHEVRARVVDIRPETPDGDPDAPVATLTLQPTSTWAGFRAGQYVQLGVDIDGARRTTRCFSVSSSQSGPGEPFTVTLRANPDGLVSRHLVHHGLGQVVHLSQAEGAFTLPAPLPGRLLLVSGGSGITPVMSMLRTLLAQGYAGQVTFLHYARTPDHQIFAAELADVVRRHPNVDVQLRHTEAGDDVFTAESLAALVPDYRDVDTWACGPAGLISLVQQAFGGSDRLRVEFFKTPAIAVDGSAGGTVSFTRSGATAANDGAPLLAQAEAAGLAPTYGCRMGICFSCTARKTEGTVRNVVTGAESSLPDEDIQICVSAPVGDCAIDL